MQKQETLAQKLREILFIYVVFPIIIALAWVAGLGLDLVDWWRKR